MRSTVIIIAKEPAAGQVKTRLIPAYGPMGAADVARAALLDTLATARRAAGDRLVLVLSGRTGGWLPDPDLAVLPQRGGGLDERLAAAFDDVAAVRGGPLLLVGMDTPQLTVEHLLDADELLAGHDSVLGPAADGGFWLLGMQRPDADLLVGVPMSVPETFAAQQDRLRLAGHRTAFAPVLRDVDHPDDAEAVADLVPGSRFAAAVHAAGAFTGARR